VLMGVNMDIRERIEQAASAYKDRVGTNYSGEYIMKDFTAGATWAIDNLKVNLSDEQSNLYVNEIPRLRAALEKIARKPKWYKDRGHECLSKHDLESVLMIASEALKK
jgi:hypothetical protein